MSTSLPSVLSTLHTTGDDIPWVVQSELQTGMRRRVLHARPEEGFIVTQIRAEPNLVSAMHRHTGPVFAYTILGAWGHDTECVYRTGTYVYETPGVVHRFYSGVEPVTEVVFVNQGLVEFVDPDTGETTGAVGPAEILRSYFEACEREGQPRPNILT
jgi:2,4'-dihydroxyacetophenone dioxygenase